MTTSSATDLKQKGNTEFQNKNYTAALSYFTEALSQSSDPKEKSILYSNRSAAHCALKDYSHALEDAEKSIECDGKFVKAYSRKASALIGLRDYEGAIGCYQKGLEVDPGNENMKRQFQECLQFMLGDLKGFMPKNDVKEAKDTGENSGASEKEMPYEEPPQVKETKEEESEAMTLKKQGDACYKQKKFEEALEFYDKSFSLEKNVSVLNNKAAVLLELHKYEEAIKVCEEAVELGRELRTDYKNIARSLARIGTAYHKLSNYENAIKYYQKSLSEYRSPEVIEKLKSVEKEYTQKKIEEYQDPEKSELSRQKGNSHFKAGDYASAIKEYTESINRNISDARSYANRSACYLKLLAVNEALKDAEKSVELDEKYCKGWVRKANAEMALREWGKAMKSIESGLLVDDGKCKAELEQLRMKVQMGMSGFNSLNGGNGEKNPQEALKDPKVQEILSDPVMRNILDQMASDPNAVKEHLKNDLVRERIMYLVEKGVVGMR